MLLILAVLAAGGIFLLDLFYLSPNVDGHKWAALREQASRTEHSARLMLQASEENLRLNCVIWSGSDEMESLVSSSKDADQAVRKIMNVSKADMVWLTDERNNPLRGWTQSGRNRPVAWTQAIADRVRSVLERRDDADASEAAGVMDLPIGPVIVARITLSDGGNSGKSVRLWLARMLARSQVRKVGFATSADLMLVVDESLPAGAETEGSA